MQRILVLCRPPRSRRPPLIPVLPHPHAMFIRRLLVIALLLAVSACAPVAATDRPARVEQMATGYESQWPEVPQVTAAQYEAIPDDQRPILVDARSPRERRISMIPGAITPDQLPAQVPARSHPPVLVYCTIGYRSTKLASELRDQGINAENLHGGVLAWAHHGGRFVTPEGEPTREVHVYAQPWDLLPDTYTSDY